MYTKVTSGVTAVTDKLQDLLELPFATYNTLPNSLDKIVSESCN